MIIKMKRIATLFSALFVCFQAIAQTPTVLETPRVDPNIELMSIVWRLAGNPEYSAPNFKMYNDRIEAHFGEYRSHELIGFVQSIIRDNRISYDAVASMAVHLDEELNLRQDVAPGSLEGRWSSVDKDRFVELLKKFAADARFDDFFAGNAEMYAEASRRFMSVCEAVDLDWYAKFFGVEPKGNFIIINGLGVGLQNYGFSVKRTDGDEEIYAIMGAWSVDGEGMAIFPMEDYVPVLLHEFNHSFVNNLTARHREAFRDSGERLFAVYGDAMRMQAYDNWETVLNEALVRAAVIKYMYDHGVAQEVLAAMVRHESRNNGFQWTGLIMAELEKYDETRDEYPTLDDYMPRLAEAYVQWAEQVEAAVAARAQATAN